MATSGSALSLSKATHLAIRPRIFSYHILPLLILTLFIFIAYANSFYSPHYLDDYHYIRGNEYIEISELSVNTLKDAAIKSPLKNRWIPNISFALDYYIFGPGLLGFHISNLLIHLSAAVTVYFLCLFTINSPNLVQGLLPDRETAMAAALLWAVNPLHTNAVTYIVQRMTSLAALFMLLSILFYAYGRLSRIYSTRQYCCWVLSMICGFLALFSKETAAMLPVMIIAYELFFLGQGKKLLRNWKANLLILTFLFFIMLLVVQYYVDGRTIINYTNRAFTLPERLMTEPRVVVFYLSLLAFPLPGRLNLAHDFPLSHGLLTPPQTLPALILICLMTFGIILLYKREKLVAFALFWYLGNLIIESTAIPLEIIFEHRVYLPSIFLVLAMVSILYRIGRNKIIFLRSMLLISVLLLSLFTWQRNAVWADTVSFWSDVTQKSPNLRRGHMGLYFALRAKGLNQQATASLERAYQLDPGNSIVAINLADLYVDNLRYNDALNVLNKFLSQQSNFSKDGYLLRAKIHGILENYSLARQDAERVFKIDPYSALAMLIIGKTYQATGKFKLALPFLESARQNGMKTPVLYNSLGSTQLNLGYTDEAIVNLKKALLIDKDHPQSHYRLSQAYAKKGMHAEAAREMQLYDKLRNLPKKAFSGPHNY